MKTIISFLFAGFWLTTSIGCSDPDPDHQLRYESTMTIDGLIRKYVVKLPLTYYDNDEPSAYPLVIALHGTGGSAQQMETSYGLNASADVYNFVIAYPEGVRSDGVLGIRTWNAGLCCDFAMENHIDDVAFVSGLIDRLTSDFHIDPKRIYVTGMSNGGMMAYRLACELPSKIAAIAAVSATMMTADCEPTRPVPILHIHSKPDTKVPFEGGVGIGGYNFSKVDSILNRWATFNGCAASTIVDNGQYVMMSWNDCDSGTAIQSYLTSDGGHAWPGGKRPAPWSDAPSAYINANDLIWQFFRRFELP